MTKSELQKFAAPVLDEDFSNIVVSAVRYALPSHSYMPSLTRDYVWRYWPLLKKHHWCILRDIREHYMDVDDINAWVSFYNLLIAREDTIWPEGERSQHTPLTPTT
jgi:hypothetical protein